MSNKVELIGNLGVNPDVRTLTSGARLATFSLATEDYYTDKNGEQVKRTIWHNIVAWNRPAEIAEMYLKKGYQVAVHGKICYHEYENKEGRKQRIAEINASSFTLLNNRRSAD